MVVPKCFGKVVFPGYSFEHLPDAGDAAIDEDAVKEQMEDYMAGFKRSEGHAMPGCCGQS